MIVPMLGDDVPRETIEQVGGTARHRLRQQPQHPCAIADDAFGAYAFLAQHAQIEGTIALGQTLAGNVVDQRQMREMVVALFLIQLAVSIVMGCYFLRAMRREMSAPARRFPTRGESTTESPWTAANRAHAQSG